MSFKKSRDDCLIWIRFCAGPQLRFIPCPFPALPGIAEELMIAGWVSWAPWSEGFGCVDTGRSSEELRAGLWEEGQVRLFLPFSV